MKKVLFSIAITLVFVMNVIVATVAYAAPVEPPIDNVELAPYQTMGYCTPFKLTYMCTEMVTSTPCQIPCAGN